MNDSNGEPRSGISRRGFLGGTGAAAAAITGLQAELSPAIAQPGGAAAPAHGPAPVLIQLTVSNTRTVEQKKALFARICEKLGDNPGVRPQDVFINLVEVAKENWSFGHGVAQYA